MRATSREREKRAKGGGSFLVAGALLFCAYFFWILLFAGGACLISDSCGAEAQGINGTNAAVAVLAVIATGAGISEALEGYRPSLFLTLRF